MTLEGITDDQVVEIYRKAFEELSERYGPYFTVRYGLEFTDKDEKELREDLLDIRMGRPLRRRFDWSVVLFWTSIVLAVIGTLVLVTCLKG